MPFPNQVNIDAHSNETVPAFGNYVFNGANWDRFRGNVPSGLSGAFLASAARTASINTPQQTNFNGKNLIYVLNVTAASGTGGLQVQLQGLDSVSGVWYNLTALPTAITATGIYAFEFGENPTGTIRGNVVQSTAGVIPRTFRLAVTAGDASSYTYSLSNDLTL